MKVSKIIETCKEILYTSDVSADLDSASDEFDEDPTEEEINNAYVAPTDAELVTCCNFVLQELYCDYSMSVRKTVAEVKNGFCDTTDLRLNKVISLCDAEGVKIPFRYTENGLYVERDGTYNLTYGVMPKTVRYYDDVVMPSPVICERTLVYGILREYFTRIGDYVSANVWHEKYQNSLRVASVKTSGQYMPKRRWL